MPYWQSWREGHNLSLPLCSVGAFQPPQGAALNKPALARLQAEENTRRLVRIANETLR